MKRTIYALLAAITLLIPRTVAAQDHTQTVRETIDRLKAQGADLSGACGAFKITNAVALELRDQGFRLLNKNGGWRAIPQPNGGCLDGDHASGPGYATDYLISINEGFVGYDLLGDGGGQNNPQWGGPENDIETVKRNISNAREPVGVAPAPQPTPAPTPTPTPAPPVVVVPPSATPEVTSLLQQIINLQQSQFDAIIRVEQTALDTNVHVKNLDRTVTQTLGAFTKFVGKYIAPAIGGYILAHQLNNNSTPAMAK